MAPDWFKPRGYKHFDAQVGQAFAGQVNNSEFVARHSWLPLIHFKKSTKRYRPLDKKTITKDRPIMYASHRDACILAKYASDLTARLDVRYKNAQLEQNVIAYRKLGRSNIDFSADAHRFAQANAPCVALCFDIKGFFDNLDHAILRNQLKRILGVKELSRDWYAVWRHVARYSFVERAAIAANPIFAARFKTRSPGPVATISEIRAAGLLIQTNAGKHGIPQGTPISSVFSNLYMIDVDEMMASECRKVGAMYRRYSDDILIICKTSNEEALSDALELAIVGHKLEINEEKTERVMIDFSGAESFQYLGFNLSRAHALIRPSSLSRRWRKLRRNLKQTYTAGLAAIAAGNAEHIYTRKLRHKFSPVGARNFSSYARRASKAFNSAKIRRQLLKLEHAADEGIRKLKALSPAAKPVGSKSGSRKI